MTATEAGPKPVARLSLCHRVSVRLDQNCVAHAVLGPMEGCFPLNRPVCSPYFYLVSGFQYFGESAKIAWGVHDTVRYVFTCIGEQAENENAA